MTRVPLSELEELDPLCPFIDVRWRGEPFTGFGVAETSRYISEYRYENGYGEGRCTSTFRTGRLMEEFHLHLGERVGESREWFENGQPKRFVRHGTPGFERRWNDAGVLVEEYDEFDDTRRTWFDDGAPRSVRLGAETREYTRSGAIAWTWRPRTDASSKLYSGIHFVPLTIRAELEELAGDWEREHKVFAWVHALLDEATPEALPALRRLLAHPSDWVRLKALELVGIRGVRELEQELRGFLGDHRVAERQFQGTASRSHTRSFDALAREALARLGSKSV